MPILILLHSISLKRGIKRGLEFANFEALKRVSEKQRLSKHIIWFIVHIILLLLIVLSISGMSLVRTTSIGGMNFIIALDTSSSMLGRDLSPSRIDVAKDIAKDFIDALSDKDVGSEIAIITFSGSALKHKDFSSEYSSIKKSIDEVWISDIPGTAIGEAIILGTNLLIPESEDKRTAGAIILITDGQSNVGIDVSRAITYANENQIVVNTVGIGTEIGAKFEETESLLKIDENELQLIAEQTGGQYFKAESKEQLYEALIALATKSSGKLAYNLTPFLYILILITVFFEWFFTVTRYRIIP